MARKMTKAVAVCALAAGATVALPTFPAWAMTAGISPDTQSVKSGDAATWGISWVSNTGDHFNVTFNYGDGTKWTASNITYTSKGLSHGFFTCSGQTFTQTLSVYDITTGASTTSTAHTNVSRGPCAPTP